MMSRTQNTGVLSSLVPSPWLTGRRLIEGYSPDSPVLAARWGGGRVGLRAFLSRGSKDLEMGNCVGEQLEKGGRREDF